MSLALLLFSPVVSAANLAPPSLTATAASSSQINLTWTDPNTNESGYQVERSLSSTSGFVLITTTAPNARSFNNTGLASSTTYYYRVRAAGSGNNTSAYSNVASARTLSPALTGPPTAPSGLTASAASSSQINLSWTDNSSNETAFAVERASASAGPWAQIGTTAAKTYASSGLSGSTTYYHRVRAYNSYGNSAYSNTASATTLAGGGSLPTAPSSLTATTVSSTQINLAWVETSSNESGFKLEVSTATTPWTQFTTVGPNVRTHSSTFLTPGTTHSYRVRAYNTSGNSAYSNTASATTQSAGGTRWSKRFGDLTDDRAKAVAADGIGNVAVTGYFQGITNFGNGLVTSYTHASLGPTRDIFLAKYGPGGTHLWSRPIGNVGSDEGTSTAIDAAGNVVVTGVSGSFQMDFGGGLQYGHPGSEIFVAKYSPTGAWAWSKMLGGNGNDTGGGVAFDGSGNVVVTGAMDVSQIGVDFGGGALFSAGLQDVFLVKYSASGAHVWSKRFGGGLVDVGSGVGVDSGGNVYVTGTFEGTVNFGGGSLTSAGGKDVFVAKYSSAGGYLWSKRFGGSSSDLAGGIAVDGAGDVAIAGRFQGSINFGGGNLTSAGGEDAYLAKLSGASGGHVWSKRFGGTSNDNAGGVDTDGAGNVVVAGYYSGSVDFGGGALVSNTLDVFAAKYSPTGGHIWSRRYGDFNYQFGSAVAAAGNGDVTVIGYFTNIVDLGSGVLTSASPNTNDAFLGGVGP